MYMICLSVDSLSPYNINWKFHVVDLLPYIEYSHFTLHIFSVLQIMFFKFSFNRRYVGLGRIS